MSKMPFDEARENRITYEVVVDCYDDEEIRMGWYYYLERKLDFPFTAEWFAGGRSKTAQVEVIDMADEDACKTNMLVEIKYRDGDLEDVFTVPLLEIKLLGDHAEREEAITDWQYWLDQGGGLIDPDEYEEY